MAPFQAGSPTGDTAAAGSPSGDTAGGATEAGSPSGDTALQVVLPGILQFAPSQTGSPTGDTVAAGSPSGDTAGGFSTFFPCGSSYRLAFIIIFRRQAVPCSNYFRPGCLVPPPRKRMLNVIKYGCIYGYPSESWLHPELSLTHYFKDVLCIKT